MVARAMVRLGTVPCTCLHAETPAHAEGGLPVLFRLKVGV